MLWNRGNPQRLLVNRLLPMGQTKTAADCCIRSCLCKSHGPVRWSGEKKPAQQDRAMDLAEAFDRRCCTDLLYPVSAGVIRGLRIGCRESPALCHWHVVCRGPVIVGKIQGHGLPAHGLSYDFNRLHLQYHRPQVSTLLEDGKHGAADRLLRRCLVAALAIGLLTALVFLIAADGLGAFFYKRDDLGLLIRLSGFCAPILDVAAVSTSLLIGVSKESQSFRNALMQQLLLLISIILLVGVPSLNIYGYILSFALSNTVLVIINLYFLKEHIFDRQSSSSLHKRGV